MPVKDDLLELIRTRKSSANQFNQGILIADRYVKATESCVGLDICQRFASKGNVSYNDSLKRAESLLTYNDNGMVVEDKISLSDFNLKDNEGVKLEMPKNTLMVFKNTLTTNNKDRDGDILRSDGAYPDPKMLLLYNHIHTLPVGKMLGVADQKAEHLKVYSAIVDINDLAHDCAVMVDNDMARFSHGFNPVKYEAIRNKDGDYTGVDVKVFEIMEESVVSVPANADTGVDEVLLSLVESKKLNSQLMKSMGKEMRQKMPTTITVPVTIQIDGSIIKGYDNDNGKSKHKCGCNGSTKTADTNTSKEADTSADQGKGSQTDSSKDNKVTCPCGGTVKDGVCSDCGKAPKSVILENITADKIMSVSNLHKLVELSFDLAAITFDSSVPEDQKSKVQAASKAVEEILATAKDFPVPDESVEASMATFLAKADETFQKKMLDVLTVLLPKATENNKTSKLMSLLKAIK